MFVQPLQYLQVTSLCSSMNRPNDLEEKASLMQPLDHMEVTAFRGRGPDISAPMMAICKQPL